MGSLYSDGPVISSEIGENSTEPASGQRLGVSVAKEEAGVVACSVYADGQRIADIHINETGSWAKKPGHVVWIGLLEPDDFLLRRIQVQLDLHPLAIEDASKAHQHPKVEQYGGALFVVARTAQLVNEHIVFGETHIFVGKGYVVSVRHGASSSYATVRERCETCPISLNFALNGLRSKSLRILPPDDLSVRDLPK